MGRLLNSRNYTLPEDFSIECRSERTSYGFRHLASLRLHGREVAHDKATYYNRTWESYEFQTVIEGVIGKHFKGQQAQDYKALIHKEASGEIEKEFGFIGAIAKLGDVLGNTDTEKNAWKRKMLKAGLPGLDFPEDFDTLPEAEKTKRLDAVVDHLTEKKEE